MICFLVHELACNHTVQSKLFEEIQTAGEAPTYGKIHELRYLEMVISEVLRKWPPIAGTDRECSKSYEMENSNGNLVTLKVGDVIWIPTFGIQRDQEYWPDPDKFDPERFNEENRPNIKSCTYLPFGNGQRTCIASRFAIMVAKTICLYLLREYSFEKCDKTSIELKLKPGMNMMADEGFWIKFVRRNSTIQ